ncbi:MAG: hypothetical protein OHK0038_00470 [Flammeovirgaceae bacterium]
MQLIEVQDKNHIRSFLEMPVDLYKNEKNWIRPLNKDIEEVFDPEKNKLFKQKGKAIRWILKNSSGQVIGRVAAFVNPKTVNKDNDQPTGGMGFFECINDQKAANMLFDACMNWLKAQGMEAMDGPINFGDRDKWWGCLVDGFTEPNYCMPYNLPYYRQLFENYGFKEYFKQYTYYRPIQAKLKDKIYEKAKRIIDNKDYSFRHLKVSQMEKYAEDFRIIYNKAWIKHGGVSQMPKEQALNIMKKMKPVVDETIVWFAYYKNEPIAFFIMLPELNQIFKYFQGNFNPKNPYHLLKFLWYKNVVGTDKIFGVVFGVVPEHQGKGVESAIVVAYANVAHTPNYKYKFLEMNWIGDFNPKMMRVAEDVGGSIYKTHITYRLLFDPQKQEHEFKRMKMIE